MTFFPHLEQYRFFAITQTVSRRISFFFLRQEEKTAFKSVPHRNMCHLTELAVWRALPGTRQCHPGPGPFSHFHAIILSMLVLIPRPVASRLQAHTSQPHPVLKRKTQGCSKGCALRRSCLLSREETFPGVLSIAPEVRTGAHGCS